MRRTRTDEATDSRIIEVVYQLPDALEAPETHSTSSQGQCIGGGFTVSRGVEDSKLPARFALPAVVPPALSGGGGRRPITPEVDDLMLERAVEPLGTALY